MDEKTREQITSFTTAYQKLIDNANQPSNTIKDYFGYSRRWRYKSKDGKYSREEIDRIIDSGDISAKIALSRYFFEHNNFYSRILLHYATLLKYIGILIPNPNNGLKLSKPSIQKKYRNAARFLDNEKLVTLFTNFALAALVDGVYYGIISGVSANDIVILDLPTSYCRSIYKDELGNDVVELNVAYFDTIVDEEVRNSTLEVYPNEIVNWYRRYKKGKVKCWCPIPAYMTVYLPLVKGAPLFLELIPAALEYEESKDINKERDLNEIRKIIVQRIPHLNDGGLLFEPDEAEYIHKGTVNMLKDDANVSVLTTYADVDAITAHSTNDNALNSVDKALKNIYAESGSSSQLFGTDSNLSLSTSITNDMALMMILARKLENFITSIVNERYGNTNVTFTFKILPISYYNQKDYAETSLKLANSGYSFLLPALAMDISQRELSNVKDLENDVLKLKEKLQPLSTSYTETGNVGRPEKDAQDKSAKTIANEESLDRGGSN